MTRTYRGRLALALLVLALGAAACGGGGGGQETAPSASAPAASESASAPAAAKEASGPACAQLPQGSANGGLEAMSVQPAGTAASTNPLLTTLVTAVKEAGLVDTLNGPGPFTIFAPINSAFEKIPPTTLQSVLADKPTLTNILTYHVHAGDAYTSDQLATMSSLKMVNDKDITLSDAGGTQEVNGQAKVVCTDIKVGNGYVHLIDSVLMPS